jgi:hypothetical protein
LHWHVELLAQTSPGAHVVPPQVQVPAEGVQVPTAPHSLFTLHPQNFWAKSPRSQSSAPVHVLPQLPQFTVLCCTSCSQPSSAPAPG